MDGFSIVLAFGKYGGFYGHIHSHSWRICLGWVALTIYPRNDIEQFMQYLRKKNLTAPTKETKND